MPTLRLPMGRRSLWLAAIVFVTSPFAVSAQTASPDAPLRDAERTFLTAAIENGRHIAEVARLAVSVATSSDLRDFAQQLATDHARMNATLETLARRKGVDVPLQPTSLSDPAVRLSAEAGAGFERAFLLDMLAANQRALQLCEAMVANARDEDLRAFAGEALPTVRDHVNKSTALEKQE